MLTDGIVRLVPYHETPELFAHALRWYADPEVLRGADGPDAQPYDAARIRRMYHYLQSHGSLYLIEVVAEDGTWLPVGDATLAPETLPIVIGDPRWRSRGIGGRTLRLLVQQARDLGWARLTVKEVYVDNRRSQRLYLSQGFRRAASGIDAQGRRYHTYALELSDSSSSHAAVASPGDPSGTP